MQMYPAITPLSLSALLEDSDKIFRQNIQININLLGYAFWALCRQISVVLEIHQEQRKQQDT